MADNLENKSQNSDVMSAETSANPQNKKFLIIIGALAVLVVGLLVAVCILAFGGKDSDGTQNSETSDGGTQNEDEKNDNEITITVIDGYVAVNGEKTQHKVHTEPVISVIDGYVAINGVKTEHEVELSCNHEWQTETIAPTCTEGGYDVKTCSVCEKRVKTNETPAKSHNFGSYVTNNEYHWMECTACDEEKNKAMHTPNDDGECEVCGVPVSDTPGIVYDVSADGTYAEVIDYTGIATKVKIASEYNGLPVKSIYKNAFESNSNITSVIIPDSVTSIGYLAFAGCKSLSFVVIPDSVTSIGDEAFWYCTSLTDVYITDIAAWCKISFSDSYSNPMYYGTNLYVNGELITELVIPDSATSIGNYAFYSCDSLSSVVIGDSVTSIGDWAFCNCTSLSSVVIPDSVTSIGWGAFSGCHSSLYTEYEYGKYVVSGDNSYAVLIEITNKNMSTYTINENTKHIAYRAFSSCSRLTSITIPDSVTSIGYKAFEECTSLSSVVIGDSVTSIADGAFRECRSLSSVVIPDSVTSIGEGAFSSCTSLHDIYYTGSAEEWAAISIGSDNYYLTYYSTKHYNYIPK